MEESSMAGRFEGVSDLEWRLFADVFPPAPSKRGRGMPHAPLRKILNTLLYVLITGCRWCDVPHGPPWASKSATQRWWKRNKKVALKHGFEGARELILAWHGWRVYVSASPLGGQCHCSSPRVLHS